MSLDFLRGVGEVCAGIFFVLYNTYQAQKYIEAQRGHIDILQSICNSLIDTLKGVDNNPTMIAAIQGATANVPPDFFERIIGALTSSKLFSETLSKLIKDVEGTKQVTIESAQPDKQQ